MTQFVIRAYDGKGYQTEGSYDIKDCSSAAHIYGKQIASGEAFTENWPTGPNTTTHADAPLPTVKPAAPCN